MPYVARAYPHGRYANGLPEGVICVRCGNVSGTHQNEPPYGLTAGSYWCPPGTSCPGFSDGPAQQELPLDTKIDGDDPDLIAALTAEGEAA